MGNLLNIYPISAFLVSSLVFAVGCDSQHDPHREAEISAITTEAHPFAGFWKEDCAHNFGLAIAPSGHMYSVSFCGPGGCFEPGTYRRDTAIEGDPMYKVVDQNTIMVEGREGFYRYVRCPSR